MADNRKKKMQKILADTTGIIRDQLNESFINGRDKEKGSLKDMNGNSNGMIGKEEYSEADNRATTEENAEYMATLLSFMIVL